MFRYKERKYQTVFDLKKYPDRTDQSFKDQCDMNRIMDKAARTGALSHINRYGDQYGNFIGFDFETVKIKLAEANSIFYALEPELRREFGNKPEAFFNYVNDPANKDNLAEKLPHLVQPGKQLPDVVGGSPPAEPPTVASSPAEGGETPTAAFEAAPSTVT